MVLMALGVIDLQSVAAKIQLGKIMEQQILVMAFPRVTWRWLLHLRNKGVRKFLGSVIVLLHVG